MPSPRQPRPLSARLNDGKEWRPPRKKASPLPPRARQLVELMVLGDPVNPMGGPLTLDAAAAIMGIKAKSTGRQYIGLPNARSYFNSLCEQIREGEVPKNLWAAIGIRDDENMKKSAAGNRVRIEAIKSIEKRDGPANVNVNVGVGVANIAPGYMVSIPEEYRKNSEKALRSAGSTHAVGDDGKTIDLIAQERDTATSEPVARTSPAKPMPPVSEPASHFDWGRKPPEEFPPLDSRRRMAPNRS